MRTVSPTESPVKTPSSSARRINPVLDGINSLGYEAKFHVTRTREEMAQARTVSDRAEEELRTVAYLSRALREAVRARNWSVIAPIAMVIPERLAELAGLDRTEHWHLDIGATTHLDEAARALIEIIAATEPRRVA